jgi:hypothetical protein
MGGPTDTHFHFDESAQRTRERYRSSHSCRSKRRSAGFLFDLLDARRVFIIGGDRKWISDCEFIASDFIIGKCATRKTVRRERST